MSDEVMPLTSILDTNAAPAKAPDPAPAPPDEAKPAVDPAAQEPAKGEDPGATPAPKAEEPKKPAVPDNDPIKVMRKALSQVQRKNAELERKLQEAAAPKQQGPDPISDPEAFTQHIQRQVSDTVWQERIADANEELSEKLGDAYEETLDTFQSMMESDPQLFNQWRHARNPGKFLLKAVEDHKARTLIGDPVAYAEKIRADTRKEIEAQVQTMVAEGIKAALAQHLPQSLADEQTQGGRAQAQVDWDGPKPIGDILSRKK